MDYQQVFAICAAGMRLDTARVQTAAVNLANANTTAAADGSSFRPLHVLARPVTLDAASSVDATQSFGALFARSAGAPQGSEGLGQALPEYTIVPTVGEPRMVYEPGHPAADARGFVAYARVDTATEMVSLMSAMRSYEANVAAMNTARNMALKALDIGANT